MKINFQRVAAYPQPRYVSETTTNRRAFRAFALVLSLLFIPNAGFAWDGYDYDTSSYIEIEKGNLVREGEEIEYYDYESGEYKYGEVESINGYGSSVEVEVYDYDSGERRTFDMEK